MSPSMTAMVVLAMAAAVLGDGGRRGPLQPPAEAESPPATLADEWMVAAPAADVLAAARRVLRERRLRIAHDDAGSGTLETAVAGYPRDWPNADALGLRAVHTPKRLALHVHVAQDLEPARLAVGVVLEVDYARVPLLPSKWSGDLTFYGQRGLSAHVSSLIAAAVGAPAEPLSSTAEGRARQASRLLPAGVDGGCGVRIAPLASPGTTTERPLWAPSRVVRPRYPEPQLEWGVTGAVTLRGEVTEHGTYTGLERIGGVDSANLRAAAIGAAGLWRWRPGLVGGCPARYIVSLEMSFAISR